VGNRALYVNEYPTAEERFWSKVWRCTHRWPCKRCCWPWRDVDLTACLHDAWLYHPMFSDVRLKPVSTGPAARWAVCFSTGTLLLPGLLVCHQYDFAPCCNPAHLCVGSHSDNMRDRRGKKHTGEGWPLVTLPDGRQLFYAEAARTYKAEWAAQIAREKTFFASIGAPWP
jgi:hypothetical protein